VTTAALILFIAFASPASTPHIDITVLATRAQRRQPDRPIANRALLLPALRTMAGRWNRRPPSGLARLLPPD